MTMGRCRTGAGIIFEGVSREKIKMQNNIAFASDIKSSILL